MSSSGSSSQVPPFADARHFTYARSVDRWYCNLCNDKNSAATDKTGSGEYYMSAEAALKHEQHSTKHSRNRANVGPTSDIPLWWTPVPDEAAWASGRDDVPLTTQEMRIREQQVHVDHVRDFVPFWMRGVEAAERGEVLRMEEFLESLQDVDAWGSVVADADAGKFGWGYAYAPGEWGGDGGGGWSQDSGRKDNGGWGRGALSVSSRHTGRRGSCKRRKGGPSKAKGRHKGENNTRGASRVMHGDSYTFVETVARQEAVNVERKQRMHIFFEMPTQDKVKKIEEVIRHLRTTR